MKDVDGDGKKEQVVESKYDMNQDGKRDFIVISNTVRNGDDRPDYITQPVLQPAPQQATQPEPQLFQ